MRLLVSINISLESLENPDVVFFVGPLTAKSNNDPPIITIRKVRMKTPLVGSEAKA